MRICCLAPSVAVLGKGCAAERCKSILETRCIRVEPTQNTPTCARWAECPSPPLPVQKPTLPLLTWSAPAPLPFPVADTNTWSAAYAGLLLTTVTVNPLAACAGTVTAKPRTDSEIASDGAVRVLHMFANLGRPMCT